MGGGWKDNHVFFFHEEDSPSLWKQGAEPNGLGLALSALKAYDLEAPKGMHFIFSLCHSDHKDMFPQGHRRECLGALFSIGELVHLVGVWALAWSFYKRPWKIHFLRGGEAWAPPLGLSPRLSWMGPSQGHLGIQCYGRY